MLSPTAPISDFVLQSYITAATEQSSDPVRRSYIFANDSYSNCSDHLSHIMISNSYFGDDSDYSDHSLKILSEFSLNSISTLSSSIACVVQFLGTLNRFGPPSHFFDLSVTYSFLPPIVFSVLSSSPLASTDLLTSAAILILD
ncbi:hypothetical protein V6N11_010475 [Hibiscus sabdariffa]|uniref:Uncharacterized protein n=1 Tax=Hibiscus sabdariffa TaxID=183260 RepID=A0ABR2S5Z2_9ROSI